MPSKQDKRAPEVGERWAYRARAVDRLDEVEVVRFGSKSPPRVLIRFVAREHEGRTRRFGAAARKVRTLRPATRSVELA
ncbi:hypothetical protein [Pseudonocardia adelaidensis]|uniref:Uncharacterized protein n=1 Tax=Pseudonocardia adelaidensis TaxID=648754 RepID=A0ABP9PC62_9PSEU